MDVASEPTQLLAAAAGVLLSLGAAYVPGFAGWYQGLAGVHKRLVMLGLLAAASLLSAGLACLPGAGPAGRLGLPEVACSQAGVGELLAAFLAALVANQATFVIAVRGADSGAGRSAGRTAEDR